MVYQGGRSYFCCCCLMTFFYNLKCLSHTEGETEKISRYFFNVLLQ